MERQEKLGWGAKVIDRLGFDLRHAFPNMKGFSPRNLKYMRACAEAWPDLPIVQGPLAQLPWYHHITLLDKVKGERDRLAYAKAAIEFGWSRDVMVLQIESRWLERRGRAVSNFKRTLPSPQSDLAQQTINDPYIFDFLEMTGDVHERAIERALVTHIRDFLLELGVGFSFVDNQVRLDIGDDEFYIDLLFYRCHSSRRPAGAPAARFLARGAGSNVTA